MPNLTLRATREDGPIVEFAVAPSEEQARAIAEAGLPPVLPQVIHGLVDTGSGITIIDEEVVSRLGLISNGKIDIKTTADGHRPRTLPTFAVRLEFLTPEPRFISSNFPVVGGLLPLRGLGAIIGRDVLSRCLLIYNGPMNEFTFSY